MQLKQTNLSAIAESITNELKEIQPGRDVEIVIQPNLSITADKGLLRIVLFNLLGNAWKFTEKQDKALIEFGLTKSKNKQAYFVRDNGVGFDMAYSDKLFQPFQRLHSSDEFKGTGIGLSTVQRIVNRHLGDIWVESKEGTGTTFYFTIGQGIPEDARESASFLTY